MSARNLVIGLDGADLDLILSLGRARLPNLHGLMDRGAYAASQSVMPPATLPNWTTFLTGMDPGRHGVFDFTTRSGYQVHFTAGTVREEPTVAARLDRQGRRCACLFFPATWPPEPLEHGIFISGWDAPVAFEADRSFVWPPALHDDIVARFGAQRFDDVDEFDTEAPGWHDRLPEALGERVERKCEVARWLLDDRDWDLFAIYFGESDTAAHHLWALHDPRSPRHPGGLNPRQRDGLGRVYGTLDHAVGDLISAAGGSGVEVTVISDHGFGGASDKVLYLNRALQQAGFARLLEGSTSLATRAKEAALTRLPPAWRDRTFRMAGALLPGLLESRARFGNLDMAHTRAFSDELNYFPAIHFNVRGREPRGIVPASELDALRGELDEALRELRDPWTGRPVVRSVHGRQELFHGDHVSRAPDLLLDLELDAGYSYNLMPSQGAPAGAGPWRRLTPDEYLGRKGRSLQGSHRARGFYAAAGPRVRAVGRVEAHIADGTATLLARMGIAPPAEFAGTVLTQMLTDGGTDTALAEAPVAGRSGGQDRARVESRLRSLGYIE